MGVKQLVTLVLKGAVHINVIVIITIMYRPKCQIFAHTTVIFFLHL